MRLDREVAYRMSDEVLMDHCQKPLPAWCAGTFQMELERRTRPDPA